MAFPVDQLPVTVELAGVVSPGVWEDISSYWRTTASPIMISRGRADEASQAAPQTANLTIDNADGRFTPRNPTGPYYGRLGRNTVCRIKVGTSIRLLGEVSDWPQRWDPSETDQHVPITVSGQTRRLGQGRPPALTGLRNYILANEPICYWPLDEGELAGHGRNHGDRGYNFYPWPVSGIFRPVIKFAAGELGFNLPNGLQILRTNAQGASEPYLRGDVALSSSYVAVDFLFRFPEIAAQLTLTVGDYGGGNWELTTRQGAFDDVQLARTNLATGVTTGLNDSAVLEAMTDGELHHMRLELLEDGADVDYNVYVDGASVMGGTVAATALNGCSLVVFKYPQLTNEQPMALGHVVVWDTDPGPASDAVNAMTGYDGETAADRIDRICGEQLVAFTLVGTAADTARMGPQIEGDILAQVRNAAAADLGTLYEPRDQLGLAYRTRASLYNQAPTATIDYAAGELAPPIEPTDDDQLTRNDITAKRRDAGSARATLETGPLSVLEPPDGVGPYPDEVEVNVHTDAQLGDVAGWLLSMGTWDESRYPVVTVERAAPDVVANPTLSNALLDVDIDDAIVIENLLRTPEDVRLLVRGYTETINQFVHTFAFNCSPAGPFQVGMYGDDTPPVTGGRYNPGGLRIWEGLTTTETEIEVLIDEPGIPGVDAGSGTPFPDAMFSDRDLPFDIMIGGERMTVTAVNTPDVQFVSNAPAVSGSNVSLNPTLPPFTQAGDLVLIFASSRALAATVDTPAGWVTLLDAGHVRVFARHYDGVWTMPTISFTGGAAGEDTIAQCCSFRGISIGVFQSVQTNAAAQNIATPGVGGLSAARVAFWLGWKADDWTSVAPINHPGAIEIQERTSGAGFDASQVWDYKIFRDPNETIPAATFVVSGGAAAASKGAVILFWLGQTLTVTRSVNGVVKSHSAGAALKMFEPARYAL